MLGVLGRLRVLHNPVSRTALVQFMQVAHPGSKAGSAPPTFHLFRLSGLARAPTPKRQAHPVAHIHDLARETDLARSSVSLCIPVAHAVVGRPGPLLWPARADVTGAMIGGRKRVGWSYRATPPLLRSDFAQSTGGQTPNGDLTDSFVPATEASY